MKKNEIDVGEYFSKYSEDYNADIYGPLQEACWNVRKVLDKRLYGTILDIGNGGVFFYNTNALEKIIAVDLAYPKEIQNTEKITFYSGDARDLSFLETEKVDCVLMQFLLHHIVEKTRKQTDESLTKLFAETRRVLKPNGRLIIVESVVFPIFESFENVFYALNSYILRLLNKPMVKFYSKWSLMSYIKKEGFSHLEFKKISLGERWIPLAPALFPGKFIVPPWLYPTRFCCITASKPFIETKNN